MMVPIRMPPRPLRRVLRFTGQIFARRPRADGSSFRRPASARREEYCMQDLTQRLAEAAARGMTPSLWADVKGDRIAIHDPIGTRTFAQTNANANRVARLLRDHG